MKGLMSKMVTISKTTIVFGSFEEGSGTVTLKKCPSIYLSQSGIETYPDTYLV